MKMAMIVAMDEDGFIGRGNQLPWKLASDMARFKVCLVYTVDAADEG